MTENTKTSIFVGIALAALGLAWVSRPTTAMLDVQSLVGQDLAKGFTDPAEAKRLRIVQFNEDTATLRDFEVAEENGLWTIPSKSGYPADADRQMAEAATSLMDRKILSVASESAGDHEQFGVIDPLSPKLEAGQKGVGTHVTISDINNEPLVDLIIGREVKDAPNQRYVREGNRDVVYVVDLNPASLTTDFDKWIEKDLLKLNPWDIEEVEIKDYSAQLEPMMTPQGQLAIRMALDPRSELTLAYDGTESKWTPKELLAFDKGSKEYQPFALGDDEELDTTKLDAMTKALGDLEIVDVARKPAGLSADLKAGTDFLDNAEALQDLRSLGFAAVKSPTGEGQEIMSSEGEVLCTTKDGVEYVLRFGDLRMDAAEKAMPAAAAADAVKKDDHDVQRYLFVMARFNEDAIPKPELEELPPLPEGVEIEEETVEEADPAEVQAEADAAAASDADAAAPIEEEEEEEETTETPSAEAQSPPEASPLQRAADPTSTDATTSETAAEKPAQSPEVEKILAERKRIETENNRKLDEYNAKLEKGRQQVKDLNLRFGDWYFVVSNETFQKIRLGRNDVVKKKDAKDEAAANGAPAANTPGLPGLPGLPSIPGAGQ